MRYRFGVVLIVLLAKIASAQSDRTIVAAAPLGIEVTKHLGASSLSAGSDVDTNAFRFNAALADRANKYPFFFPAGDFGWTETITVPNRSSYQVIGVSTGRNAAESQYVNGWGGNATRWQWKGAAGGTMISVPGWGFHLDGVRLEGNPRNKINGVTRPGIGIHYVAPAVNKAPTSSSMRLGWLSFDGMDCGIFCGHDKSLAASPDENGDYKGHTYTHADTVFAQRLDFRAIQQAGYWTANQQAVQHNIQHVEAVAFASASVPVFKIQRGGGVRIGYLQALNNCTFFEIDKLGNTPTVTLDAWGADAQANNICLVRFNTGPINNRISRAVVDIGPGEVQAAGSQYLIDTGAGGKNCTITLRGVRGLTANCFKLNGFSAGGPSRIKHCCVVNLIACEIAGVSSPAELVHKGAGNSTTLWQLNWTDCVDRQETVGTSTYGNYPISDGSDKAADMP
jgi:hypothetical protein